MHVYFEDMVCEALTTIHALFPVATKYCTYMECRAPCQIWGLGRR